MNISSIGTENLIELQSYCYFIRVRLWFALLKSVLVVIRGVRSKISRNEPMIGGVSMNLIPYKADYDG